MRGRRHKRRSTSKSLPGRSADKSQRSETDRLGSDQADLSAGPDELVPIPLEERIDQSLTDVVPDPADRDEAVRRTVRIVRQESYAGPVPHPSHFAEYERVCPGIGSRLVGMAETAMTRAEDRQDSIVANEHVYSMSGLWLAALVLIVFVVSGTVLCLNGKEAIGAALLALSGLAVIASKFIDGKKRSGDEKLPSPAPASKSKPNAN